MRSLIQTQLKEKDNPFKGQPSQVLDTHTGVKYKGPKVGEGGSSDEAPLDTANHRGGV